MTLIRNCLIAALVLCVSLCRAGDRQQDVGKRIHAATKFLAGWPSAEQFRQVAYPWARGPINPETLKRALAIDPRVPCVVETVDEFFACHCEDKSWHEPDDRQRVRQWRELRDIFTNELRGSRVIYVQAPKTSVYLLGCDPHRRNGKAGGWIGIKTTQWCFPAPVTSFPDAGSDDDPLSNAEPPPLPAIPGMP